MAGHWPILDAREEGTQEVKSLDEKAAGNKEREEIDG